MLIQCANPDCKIDFEPNTWNQKFHDLQCRREAERAIKKKESEAVLQELFKDSDSSGKPKILLLDIETSPNLVYTWGLWNQNIGINQIEETSRVICFSAKWLGSTKSSTMFYSVRDGDDVMIKAAWDLLDQADAVMHYNGTSFDIPHLNREFLEARLGPPSPYQNIDLYRLSKKFMFQSRKLEHVSTQLGFEGKVQHEGFNLWRKCLQGDDKAWKAMEKYNRRDVTLMEEMYAVLIPWIPALPNRRLYDMEALCPRCGSKHVQRRGISRTTSAIFQQYQCQECKGWFKDAYRSAGADFISMASC